MFPSWKLRSGQRSGTEAAGLGPPHFRIVGASNVCLVRNRYYDGHRSESDPETEKQPTSPSRIFGT
jgi:hypothetical protein